MRILITAGGTIVKIDDVRHIGNFSTGSFPEKIACAALARGHEVIYFHAKGAKIPDTHRRLKLATFETYDDYTRGLKEILRKNTIKVVLLAAAVSDYGIKQHKGKISSSKFLLVINLHRLPKVIKSVKKWSKVPLFQVGFKLASGVTDKELVEIAYKSSLESGSDLTVASNLSKIQSGKREAVLVTPEKGAVKLREPGVAEKIVEFVERRAMTRHFRTVLVPNRHIGRKYHREIRAFRTLCGRLHARGLMPDFFTGASSGHGSLSLRTVGNSFLITARGSDKKNLRSSDVVLVRRVDWKKREITVESSNGKKASFNAVLVSAVFEKFPKIRAVVHAHGFIKNAPTTEFAYTPGTVEYATKPVQLFKKGVRAVNLKNHGSIAIGDDLNETAYYAFR